jgi:hypothetical protein
MALAAIIISSLSVTVAAGQLYWASQLIKGRRELAEMRRYNAIRAARQAMPLPVIHVEGTLTPEAERRLRDDLTQALRNRH